MFGNAYIMLFTVYVFSNITLPLSEKINFECSNLEQ